MSQVSRRDSLKLGAGAFGFVLTSLYSFKAYSNSNECHDFVCDPGSKRGRFIDQGNVDARTFHHPDWVEPISPEVALTIFQKYKSSDKNLFFRERSHQHEINLSDEQLENLMLGKEVQIETEPQSGHKHLLRIKLCMEQDQSSFYIDL